MLRGGREDEENHVVSRTEDKLLLALSMGAAPSPSAP